ncbi:hypothetical protein NVP1262O_17 [Vibrio phage 1.262.O._10N.286.51.A9]|nr:hypothetical protein NVP1262O_17 [Vibrio phage 1.262.O._10N.286.51.A9]
MSLFKKNWYVISYTTGTPTPLVAEPAIIATIVLNNASSSDITVEVTMWDTLGNVELAPIVVPFILGIGETKILDFNSFAVMDNQAIYVEASGAGAGFFASGVQEVL